MGYDSYRTSRIFYYMAIAIKMYGNTTTYTYDKLLRLTSYVNQAGDDYTYFINEPFLDDGINSGKIFSFSHNPIGDTGALGREFQYLLQNGYQFVHEYYGYKIKMKYLNTEKKKLVEFYMILFSLAVIWMINMEDLAQEYVSGNKNIQLQNF